MAKISKLQLPRFSLAEREARWGRIREAMAARKIDCLLTPHNAAKWGEFQADTRYVAQIGNGHAEAWCVFPKRGDVSGFVRNGGTEIEWELGAQDWVTDMRSARGWHWSEVVIERLRELGLDRGKIAVAGLEGYVRGPEGVVNYTTFRRILDAFPEASFENANPWLQELRIVKSEEEIAFLERATELAEASIAAMIETAAPGVSEPRVYAAMIYAGLQGGGEYPWMNRFAAGPETRRTQWLPTQRPVEPGDLLVNETDGKYVGYSAQVVHHVQVGNKIRDDYRRMMDCSIEMFQRVLEAIGPEAPLRHLVQIYGSVGKKHGFDKGGYLFIGRGLGDDPPMGGGGSEDEPGLERKLQVGNDFCWKPRASDGRKAIGVGDTVAVTPSGARQLDKAQTLMAWVSTGHKAAVNAFAFRTAPFYPGKNFWNLSRLLVEWPLIKTVQGIATIVCLFFFLFTHAFCFVGIPRATAAPLIVKVNPIELDLENPGHKFFGDLTFLSGFELTSGDSRFGGLSGLELSTDGNLLYAISDHGYWLTARLHHNPQGRLTGLGQWKIAPLFTPDGSIVSNYLRDAEALVRNRDGSFIVAFERAHRLWRYPRSIDPFTLLPEPLPTPAELQNAPANGGLEAVTILPDRGLLVLTEKYENPDGSLKGWLIHKDKFFSLSYLQSDGFRPTDLATLANGDVLLLERRYILTSGVTIRIRLLSRGNLKAGARLEGKEIALLGLPLEVDNFEGLAVREDPKGGTFLYMISDDNYSILQRTLLLQFHMPSPSR